MLVRSKLVLSVPVIAVALVLVAPKSALSDDQAKSYPEQGKIVGTGTTGHTKGQGTAYSHTYKVETDKAILEVDCGKTPFIGSGIGKECGGDKKLQMGDEVRFRIEKSSIFIPITEGDLHHEQKLRIMAQEAKPDSAVAK